ncbi:porin [Ascidiaceihabitans donghaensis]|nr:porin [Ascidiaceihabitans donghaensis]
MKTTLIFLTASAATLSLATSVLAQDTGFEWEGEIEIGVDSTVSADDPAAEITDTYVSAELEFEAAIAAHFSVFGGLTLESVLDATDDRTFDDLGLYFSTLGLRYTFDDTQISVGKIAPVFARAWDEAPGFYGTTLAEDYELSEMIGMSLDTALGGGTLSLAVFYADDTGLSNSIGTKRGRNSTANGGVGNTGKLNNFAVQYSQEFGDTSAWVGARHLSAGTGDVSDETGVVVGASHSFSSGWDVIGEVSYFDGVGGTDDSATYVTAGAAYGLEDWTFSAAATVVNHSNASNDSLITLGVDRALTETIEVGFGVARFDVGGEKSTSVGLSAVMSF